MRRPVPSKVTSRRWPLSTLVALAAVVALLAGQTGAFARLQATLSDPSPAGGHASVVAQGVAEMPVDPVAWRVVADTAEPLDSAQAVERALGFVVTTTDGVNLADATAGTQQRLAPGEAAFVPEGAIQIRASLTDETTPYLRVGLVGDSEANDAGSDDLVFGGQAFNAPSGQRDVDLVRDVLGQDETSTVAGSEFPTLVIATAGSISVDAGSEPVALAAGEAAEFTGDLTITGAEDDSAFVAGVIGPEVPVPPRTAGTVTLGIYLCSAGITPGDLGDPIDAAAAADCDVVSEGVATTLTTPDGNELALDDADNEEGGLFAWTGLPFGDYTIAAPTELPEGATDPTFVDSDGNVLDSGDLTIDSGAPDARIDLYLFQGGDSGSISVTVYDCPAGVPAADASPDTCASSAGGFDLSVVAADGTAVEPDGAASSGETYVWTGLGLSGGGDTDAGNYGVLETVPDGFASVAADGAIAGDDIGAFSVVLTQDAPNAVVSLYNLREATGTITLDTIVCPDGFDVPDTCTRDIGPGSLSGVFIQDTQGQYGALTEGNAAQVGSSPFVWANVPLADYAMDTSGLVGPDGYDITNVVLTPDASDVSGGFSVTADVPIANIVVVLVPVDTGEATPPAEEADADGDGLADTAEATAGTDPANPDTDGDCHADGAEVVAGTDPLDAESLPDGDCDTLPDS